MESLLYIKHKKAEGKGELLQNQKKKEVNRVLCIYFEMGFSLSFFYNVLIGTTPGLTWESLLLSLGEKNLPPVSHLGLGWKSSLETANGSMFNFKWEENKSEAESDSVSPRLKKEHLGPRAFNQHHSAAWADTSECVASSSVLL